MDASKSYLDRLLMSHCESAQEIKGTRGVTMVFGATHQELNGITSQDTEVKTTPIGS
jgi:hypothetical protein